MMLIDIILLDSTWELLSDTGMVDRCLQGSLPCRDTKTPDYQCLTFFFLDARPPG